MAWLALNSYIYSMNKKMLIENNKITGIVIFYKIDK